MDEVKTILVIEDNQDNQYLVRYILESHNYNVITADNGKDGYELAVASKPDLVIMDLMMPLQNGWETTTLLRSNPDLKSIPVIALSAAVSSEDIEAARDSGCCAYIAKPIDINEFIKTVQEWI